uniref:Cyclin N-terminal domain-containing protein n=1 Tax=Macrostomum lignano TaxID=282301 RepID=A0A1I8F8U8_9PLAT
PSDSMPAQPLCRCARHQPICATKSCWCSLLTRLAEVAGVAEAVFDRLGSRWLSSGPSVLRSRNFPPEATRRQLFCRPSRRKARALRDCCSGGGPDGGRSCGRPARGADEALLAEKRHYMMLPLRPPAPSARQPPKALGRAAARAAVAQRPAAVQHWPRMPIPESNVLEVQPAGSARRCPAEFE